MLLFLFSTLHNSYLLHFVLSEVSEVLLSTSSFTATGQVKFKRFGVPQGSILGSLLFSHHMFTLWDIMPNLLFCKVWASVWIQPAIFCYM